MLDLPDKPQITVPRGQHRRLSPIPCELHWADEVPSDGVCTGKLRTVLDCARTLPFEAALTVADSALRLGAVDRSQLLVAAAELTGPGARRARRVAAAADGRAESPLESVLRSILIEAGIDGFVPQVVIRDGTFSARIDLGHPGLLIALEADGFAYHSTRTALTRDCRRQVNLTLRGWRLLRFSWEDVMFDRAWSWTRSGRRWPYLQAITMWPRATFTSVVRRPGDGCDGLAVRCSDWAAGHVRLGDQGYGGAVGEV